MLLSIMTIIMPATTAMTTIMTATIATTTTRDHHAVLIIVLLAFSSLPQHGARAPSTAGPLQDSMLAVSPCG
jgi:hypothetical protein